ncbi:MAG: sigma-70 family RNA polymerase sigma factor [Gemmatimonadaceae bacterium]
MPDKHGEHDWHPTNQMATVLSLVFPNAADRPAEADALRIALAQRGDVDAFNEIYRIHAGRVYALCLRLTADTVKARELTQDVFVRAWEALPSFRGDANLTTWLHRIAVNAMLMQRRSEKRRSARITLADDDDGDERLEMLEGVAAPRDVATAIDLERAVAALPPGMRRAFVLHDVEGYSHDEIARMTGLAAGTLRAQLHRARQLLMKALSL